MKQRTGTFRFKRFEISDYVSAMKIGTDGVLIGAWAFSNSQCTTAHDTPLSIVDAGAGTGLIALMMAQRFPNASITAIEINPEAADEARLNVAKSPWTDRIEVTTGDFMAMTIDPVDAIVSNPPFFSTGELSPTPSRATARHEASLSIDSLIERSASMLNTGGRLAMITPAERLDEIVYRGAVNHLDTSRITLVKPTPQANPIRVMVELTKGLSKTFDRNELAIRDNDGLLTKEYKSLTNEFYL